MATRNPDGEKRSKGWTTNKARWFGKTSKNARTQKYDWCMLGQRIGDVLLECLYRFPKIESFENGRIEALELCLAGLDVLGILPIGFRKGFIYQLFCLAKLSSSNPNANVWVISSLNGIVEEEVIELTEGLKGNDAECMIDSICAALSSLIIQPKYVFTWQPFLEILFLNLNNKGLTTKWLVSMNYLSHR